MEQIVQVTNRKSQEVFAVLLIIALALVGGFWLGSGQKKNEVLIPEVNQNNSPQPKFQIGPSSIIKSQQATAFGTVIKVDGRFISLQADDGATVRFKLAPVFLISTASSTQATASRSAYTITSQNSTDIVKGKKAIVFLDFQDPDYLVTSITYPSASK